MPPSLPCLFALSCYCSLPAQLPPGAATIAPGEKILPWAPTLGGGWVRRLLGVFWEGNEHLAAVGLRGTAAGLAVAPGVSSIVVPLDLMTIAADAVELRLAGGPGSPVHDALLFSGATSGVDLGIAWCGTNGVTEVLELTEPEWWRSVMLTTRNDGTNIDVIGKAFSGSTLLRARYDTLQGTFVTVPGVPIAAPIRDLCIVNFDADEIPDAAVLTDSELRIVDLAGSTLFSLPLALPGGAIEAVPQVAQRNSIALLRRRAAPAGWELVHISQTAVQSPQPVTLQVENFTFTNLVAGDFDGDAIHDLAIQDGGNAVRLVLNHGAAPHFADADAIAPLTVGGPGSVQGSACARDWDHDGPDDLLISWVAVDGSAKLSLLHGTRSWITPSAPTLSNIFSDFAHEIDGGDALHVRLLPGAMSGFTSLDLTGYVALEQHVWSGQLAPQRFRFSFSADEVEELGGDFRVLLPGTEIDFPNLFFVQVQLFDDAGVQRPSFLTGGTIDHEEQIQQPESAYLDAKQDPNAAKQEVTRYQITPRKLIGLHVKQVSLPIR